MGADGESGLASVRAATRPSVQERVVAPAGVAVERAAYGVLGSLGELCPVRLTDLARQLGLDPSTASRQVKALAALGMVARVGDPGDGRFARLLFTPAGSAGLVSLLGAPPRLFP